MPTAEYRIDHLRHKTGAALACVLIFGLAALVPAEGRCAPPTLTCFSPAGAKRGTCVTTTCTGEFSWPVEVWAPGVTVSVGEEKGQLNITVPADLPANRVWIRLFNSEGSSAALPFLIGNLNEIDEHEPNDSPRDAQSVADAAITINGVLQKKDDVDSYAVQLTAGQTLVAAVDAHDAMGSPMDAVLQIVSQDGRALAENHDDVGLDPRITFVASDSGTFVVRVFAFPAEPDTTIAFRGGENYVYRLTLTTGPFITHALPFSAPQADANSVEVMGWNLPPETKLPVVPFNGAAMADQHVVEAAADSRIARDTQLGFIVAPSMAGNAFVRLVPHDVLSTVYTNDTDPAVAIPVPIAVAGWLREPRQTNTYRLTLQKGQQVVIAAESRILGLPTVPIVQLIDPMGMVVAESPKRGPEQDAVVSHGASSSGDYRLTVTDRYTHGGDHFMYRLTVRLDQADFTLSLDTDAIIVNADKPTELPITIERRTVADTSIGPITIEAVDLPTGVTAEPAVSEPAGESAKKVTLNLTATDVAYSGPIRIRGTAEQPSKIVRFGRTPPRFGARFESLWLTAIAPPATSPTDAAPPTDTAADANPK